MTVNKKVLDDYQKYLEIGGSSSNTIKSYMNSVNDLMSYLGDTDYNEVTVQILEKYIKDLDLSDRSKNQTIYAIRNFWKFLHREGYVNTDVARLIRCLKVYNKPAEYLSREEVEICLDYLDGQSDNKSIVKKTIFLTLIYTGLRRSELLALRIEDIKENVIIIEGKGKKVRKIPIADKLKEVLNNHIGRRKQGLVFKSPRSNRKGLSASTLLNYIKEIGDEALGRDISVHTLRHTTATMLYENGADLHSIANVLGHESIATTQIYAHISRDRKQNMMNTIGI